MGQDVRSPSGHPGPGSRCIALVGPFQSGKTTLLEAILARAGTIPRAGSVAGDYVGKCEKHSLGDLEVEGMVIGAERADVTPADGATEEVRVPVQFVIDGEPQVGDFFVAHVGATWLVHDRPAEE